MAVLVGEAVDFVLDAGAVTGSQASDATVEHGGPVKPLSKQVVNLRRGVGDVARHLLGDGVVGEVAEPPRVDVSRLLRHLGVVQGPAVDPWWGSGLHAPTLEPQFDELLGDALRCPFSGAAAAKLLLTNVHQAIQEGAVGEHDGLRMNGHTEARLDANTSAILGQDADDAVLPKVEVGCGLQHFSPGLGKEVAVVLCPGAPHRWAFGLVQHPELDGAAVRDQTRVATHGVDLSYDLAFGDATHRRVAGHLSNHPHVHGDEQR